MIKFYERVFDIIGERYNFDKDGDIVVTPGTFHTVLRYVNSLSEIEKFSLFERTDNKEFVLTLNDGTEAELKLEEDEEFIDHLNKIDEETVQEMHESIESLMTEEDYQDFESLVNTLKSVYAWEEEYNAS